MQISRALLLLTTSCLMLTGGCAYHSRPVPAVSSLQADPAPDPAFAEKIQAPGVSALGKVNDFVFRGSQPNAEGIKELKKLGIGPVQVLDNEGNPLPPATAAK